MAKRRELRTIAIKQLEVDPSTLSGVPAGSDGQLVPVTDQAGNKLWLREGGTLVPAIDVANLPGQVSVALETKENFTIEVDYVNGIVPPANTVITNQAEYDALGGAFKYLQDAFNSLPLYMHHWVDINLVAGEHYAKPGVGGTTTVGLVLPQFQRKCKAQTTASSRSPWTNPTAVVHGVTSKMYEAISGTVANYSFTRTSGTWTANELAGKRLMITSGASAGSEVVIYENDDTIAKFCGKISTIGACVIDVLSLESAFIPLIDGVTPTTASFSGVVPGNYNSQQYLGFNHVAFGSDTNQCPAGNFGIGSRIYYCDFKLKASINLAYYCYSSIYGSWFKYSSTAVASMSTATLWTQGCLFTGSSSSRFIRVVRDTMLYLVDNVLVPTSVVEVVTVEDNGKVSVAGKTRVLGNGSCRGFMIRQDSSFGAGYVLFPSANTAVIANCSEAIRVQACFDSTHLQGFDSVESIGNTTGLYVCNGSVLCVKSPETLIATNQINLDGIVYTYADIPNAGDTLIGQYGSKIKRVNWY